MPLGPVEQCADAETALALGGEAPVLVDVAAPTDLSDDRTQRAELQRGQHEVVPAGERLDPLRQVVETRTRLGAARPPEGPAERLAGGGRLRARRGDRVQRQVELRGQRLERAVRRRAALGEQLPPVGALLGPGRPGNVDSDRRPTSEPHDVLCSDDDPGRDLAGERRQPPVDVRVGVVVHLDEEDGGRQDELPLPQAGSERALLRQRGKVRRRRDEQAKAGHLGAALGDGAARLRVGADEERRGRRAADRRGEASRRRGLRGRQCRQSGHVGGDPEPLVDVAEAGEVVQHSLVDPERARRHRLAWIELQQPPAPERAGRGKGAPVRFGEAAECERERRPVEPFVARRHRAEAPEPRLELDPGAEQQQVAFERRQPERLHDEPERRGPGRLARCLRPGFEQRRDAVELARQRALVLVQPGAHGIVTVGSLVLSNGSVTGLSAPSTWTRTKYVPDAIGVVWNSGRSVVDPAARGFAWNV